MYCIYCELRNNNCTFGVIENLIKNNNDSDRMYTLYICAGSGNK